MHGPLIEWQGLKCGQGRWLKVRIMKLSPKVLNKFIKLLLGAQWLSMTIKHVDSLIPLLGTERADSAKEVKRLVLHGQISTFPEEVFESVPFIGPVILSDLFMQSTIASQVAPTLKHGLETTIRQGQDSLPC